jgi:dTDP-4-amino-4,6-dideoxygalactose transaminase
MKINTINQIGHRINELLQNGDLFRYTSGISSDVSQLERDFSRTIGVQYSLAVSSCSSAIFLALKALDLTPGSKVLMPGFTFAAVPSAVIHANLKPVFLEIDFHLRIDIDDLKVKIKDVRVLLLSHMRGHISDLDEITKLCAENNVVIIEDAAHAFGASWDGRPIGTFGVFGCYSFQSYKMINGGEGGILISNDSEMISKAVIMSGAYESNWQSHMPEENHLLYWSTRLPLFNMRMSNPSAVIIKHQIPHAVERISSMRRKYELITDHLRQFDFFMIPQKLPKVIDAPDSVQFGFNLDISPKFIQNFYDNLKLSGLNVTSFSLNKTNARAFWNWGFLDSVPELPKTRGILERYFDMRIMDQWSLDETKLIASQISDIAQSS